MPERSKEQILDQVVFAVAEVVRHYGPGFSGDGLRSARHLLSFLSLRTDQGYREREEGHVFADFRNRIAPLKDWDTCDFDETVAASRDLQPLGGVDLRLTSDQVSIAVSALESRKLRCFDPSDTQAVIDTVKKQSGVL